MKNICVSERLPFVSGYATFLCGMNDIKVSCGAVKQYTLLTVLCSIMQTALVSHDF